MKENHIVGETRIYNVPINYNGLVFGMNTSILRGFVQLRSIIKLYDTELDFRSGRLKRFVPGHIFDHKVNISTNKIPVITGNQILETLQTLEGLWSFQCVCCRHTFTYTLLFECESDALMFKFIHY